MGKYFNVLEKLNKSKNASPPPPSRKESSEGAYEKAKALRLDTSGFNPDPQPNEGQTGVGAKNDVDPYIPSLLDPASPAGEAFKLLRARLLVESPQKSLKAIIISSPEPLDGKTLVASNLAVSIAHGINEHVLLVNCDLRRPSVLKRFGMKSKKGIREYLENGGDLAPYMIKTEVKKLTILPAGEIPPNPSELLSSEKMRNLVQELKDRYEDRYVIFDAPPTHFTAETATLVSMVDSALLVVREGKTSAQGISDAINSIGPEKIRGIVFNASTESNSKYGYYYKYYQKGS